MRNICKIFFIGLFGVIKKFPERDKPKEATSILNSYRNCLATLEMRQVL
jgi:hypothetical protein